MSTLWMSVLKKDGMMNRLSLRPGRVWILWYKYGHTGTDGSIFRTAVFHVYFVIPKL